LGRATERGLPMIRVLATGEEKWFYTDEEVEAFYRANNLVDDETARADGQAAEARPAVSSQTLHEVKAINRGLDELRRRGLGPRDLLPPVRVAGREPPPRFILQSGEHKKVLPHLRDLVAEVRRLGEKGMVVTRFKGLGEMDAEDLWETTLDPARRTLLQVRLDDATLADEMFRTLMGEKVEARREFIQTHSLDVKDLDYHGA
jgi:DNA gyrase subunit B